MFDSRNYLSYFYTDAKERIAFKLAVPPPNAFAAG